MIKNMSNKDRIIRMTIGALALIIGFILISFEVSLVSSIVLLIFGFILTITATLGYCPLYQIINIQTSMPQRTEKNISE